ncbi:hypothetical protein OG302_24155 [Streptomyces sp. NBC_01283]|uniref:hypothetical protein n=1 Tax=Streptomyces sp. NBC_01283 TaxID=2903812 RepID=UPI00352EAC58|nr:hypothetical protein OG302_24155 [Streptomyces sp. NBC_01283]
MRRQQLELITIRAVEHVLSGRTSEDSLIEFKATWPEVAKVRQLAGHANGARGEEIIWIIGVDEKAHTLTNPERQDSAQWWAQMSKRFDGLVAPEMTDLVVPIGDSGAVTSLLFQTDRSPYVITVPSGGAVEREVPIRDGTRTRSATRHELLRLLVPAATLPDLSVLDARLTISEVLAKEKKRWTAHASAMLYIEQGMNSSCFFPAHGMHGSLETHNGTTMYRAFTKGIQSDLRLSSGDSGVQWRADGAIANGPTAFDVLIWTSSDGEIPENVAKADGYTLNLSFEVAGSDRTIPLPILLTAPEVSERHGFKKLEASRATDS